MKRLLSLSTPLLGFALLCSAAVPPPEELLAADTLAVLTVPDLAGARAALKGCSWSTFWDDPAMKPFRDKFVAKFKSDFVAPLEKELGLRFADYEELGQGQLTLALTGVSVEGKGGPDVGLVLLMDAKDKSEALQKRLAELRKKWVDGGKQMRTEKVRDVEFSVLIVKPDELAKTVEKALSGAAPKAGQPEDSGKEKAAAEEKFEWLLGQSDSLLIGGTSAKEIEKVLIRQSGGSVPSLAEQVSFAADRSVLLRNTLGYVWVNLETVLKQVTKVTVEGQGEGQGGEGGGEQGRGSGQFLGVGAQQFLSALGVNGMKSWGASFQRTSKGTLGEMMLRVPASSRTGIFKLVAFEAIDANPPLFVPADAAKFSRVRLDLRKTWNSLESLVQELNPQLAGLLKMLTETAGKDKDPNFDFRKNLIDNLGNDIVHYEKLPRTSSFEDLASPPALWLVSSPSAEQLSAALSALGGSMTPEGSKVKEKDFLGRKVYSVNLPGAAGEDGKRVARTLHCTASGGYVALTTDEPLMEEFLRSSANPGKSLRDLPGLAEAAEKVGGMSTGLFGYENPRATMRAAMEAMKKEAGSLNQLFSGSPLAGRLSNSQLSDWVDFSLLPDFDKVAKYFHHTSVWAGAFTPEGFRFSAFSPDPPEGGP